MGWKFNFFLSRRNKAVKGYKSDKLSVWVARHSWMVQDWKGREKKRRGRERECVCVCMGFSRSPEWGPSSAQKSSKNSFYTKSVNERKTCRRVERTTTTSELFGPELRARNLVTFVTRWRTFRDLSHTKSNTAISPSEFRGATVYRKDSKNVSQKHACACRAIEFMEWTCWSAPSWTPCKSRPSRQLYESVGFYQLIFV